MSAGYATGPSLVDPDTVTEDDFLVDVEPPRYYVRHNGNQWRRERMEVFVQKYHDESGVGGTPQVELTTSNW